MARITLQQKWDALMNQVNILKQKHIYEIPIPKYDKIYSVNRFGEIEEKIIKYYGIWYKDETGRKLWAPSYDKKPTGKDLEYLNIYFEKIHNCNKVISVHYKYMIGASYVHGAYKYSEIIESEIMSFDKNDLIEIANKNKEIYGAKEGYSPCAYCGKQVKNELLISSKIIGRGRKDVWNSWKKRYESKACVTENYLKFCSGECAGNRQMSREG